MGFEVIYFILNPTIFVLKHLLNECLKFEQGH